MKLEDCVTSVAGIGVANAKKLARLGVFKIGDLLEHFPFRYEDYSTISSVKSLRPGSTAAIRARVSSKSLRRTFRSRKNILEVLVSDPTGSIKIIWFNQPYLNETLKQGEEYYFSGTVSTYDHLQMQNPSWEPTGRQPLYAGRIVPVYPLTQGLSQHWMRKMMRQILSKLPHIPDHLPSEVINRQKLISYQGAVSQIHFPNSAQAVQQARQRLAFEELFFYQVRVAGFRHDKTKLPATSIPFQKTETEQFIKRLPYTLTNSQKSTAWSIIKDMGQNYPMRRLLVGDVGSGKTVVAAMACLQVNASGGTVSIMAPTEILAEQHFKTFSQFPYFKDKQIMLLTGQKRILHSGSSETLLSPAEARAIIKNREACLIIGTHALIQKSVEMKGLSLVIIDEQHRFGVNQRSLLQQNRDADNAPLPHFLSITATPIPRTLALTIYGDLDISRIDALPAGRKQIITKLFTGKERLSAYTEALKEIKKGRQVFVVCPLIDPSDKLGVKSATEEHERLHQSVFARAKLGLLHGKLKSAEKEKVIRDFRDGRLDVLVATTVVEVGVDFPNATTMIIENSERFGLAQLHQLRGRVGRSDKQSYCFLLTDNPSDSSLKRLRAMTEHFDGAKLAELDLQLRGPGDLYGKLQSGYVEFKIADIFDHNLITAAAEEARVFMQTYRPGREPVFDAKISELQQDTHGE